MLNKKFLILILLIISLISISVVSASEIQSDSAIQTDVENIDTNVQEDVEVIQEEQSNVQEEPDIEDEDQIISNNKQKTALKEGTEESSCNAYIKPLTTYYVSGKSLSLGWTGYFNGDFKVYKSSSCIYTESISGTNRDLYWTTDDLDVGKYVAKLIFTNGTIAASGNIVINKATTKVTVKSLTTIANNVDVIYAQVTDKRDGATINGGYLKFRIAGKNYKAKLNDGLAILKFRAPKKAKKFTCKVTFTGDSNIASSYRKFTLRTKKASKTSGIFVARSGACKKVGNDKVYFSVAKSSDSQLGFPGVSVMSYIAKKSKDGWKRHTDLDKLTVVYQYKGKIYTKYKKIGYASDAYIKLPKGFKLIKMTINYHNVKNKKIVNKLTSNTINA